MILILKHIYYGPPTQIPGSYNYEVKNHKKKLLFYHYEDIENYIRNNVSYSSLISLEIERIQIG